MSKVINLGITKNNNNKIEEVKEVKLLAGKGIIGDRHFNESNSLRNQITLIESENIDYYNKKFQTDFSYLDFRRNVITQGIKLNDLVGKILLIGNIKVKGHDLCRPCKHLEETLNGQDIVKEFLSRGGLRCEILTSGIINLKDKISII